MSFTQRCGKCGEVIQQHFVVRTKSGEKVICPRDHKRVWMLKWRWKYKTFEESERGYMRTAFRSAKVGQPGAMRPTPMRHNRRSALSHVCDYCRLDRREHEGKALYCPTERNMREAPDERDRFGKRGVMERYAVLDKNDYIIGFVKSRWVHDAAKRAKKLYGTDSVMVVNTRKAKVGEHLFNKKPRKKLKNRAPWRAKRKTVSGPKAGTCGYCGGKTGVMPMHDKKYKTVCNPCFVRITKARERAKAGKFGSDRDPKKKKPKKWIDFIREMKGDRKFRKKNGDLDLRKLATAYRAYLEREGHRPRRRPKPSLITKSKHPDMNGLHIKYSRMNGAYFVMWHDAVLKLTNTRGEAETFVRQLTSSAKVSNDRDPRIAYYVTVRFYYLGKAKQVILHVYAESSEHAKRIARTRMHPMVKVVSIHAEKLKLKRPKK